MPILSFSNTAYQRMVHATQISCYIAKLNFITKAMTPSSPKLNVNDYEIHVVMQ